MNSMKTLTLTILPLVLSLGSTPLYAGDTGSHELASSPEVGVRLRREISTHYVLVAETMRTVVDGEESLSQRLFDIDCTQNLTVVDEVLEKEGATPTRFRRDYLKADFEVDSKRSLGGSQSKDRHFQGKGSVQGKGVVFTWLPEEKEFGRYYDKTEGIEEVLPGLTPDLTIGSIVPAGKVEPGATWDLAPHVLLDLFANGGDTDFGLKGQVGHTMLRTMRMGLGLNIEQVFGGKEEGTVKAFLMGTELLDGRELALIQLTFDVKLEHDIPERAQSGMSIQELSTGFLVKSNVVHMELSGSGTLRWDIAGGYLHDTKELRASERVGTTLVQTRQKSDGEEESMIQQLVMVGTMSHSIRCTPVE